MKTKYLAFAAVSLILASCSNDEDFVPQDDLKDTPITVTAGVAGLATRAGYETNDEDDTKSVLPATFYLTITQEEGNSQYNYTNVEMTKGDENDYSPEYTLLWKDDSRSFIAANAYTTEGTTFSVQTDQSTADNVLASDLLGAIQAEENSDIAISEDNIGITFRHLLCKMDVTYSWGTELQTEAITSKSVKSVIYKGFGTDVTLTRETAAVANGSSTAEIKAYVDGEKSEAIFAPYWGETPQICIIIETTTEEGDEAVTADRSFVLNVTAPTDGFTPGNRYTMNVTIGGTIVENGSVEVTMANGWSESETGNMATN